MGRPIKSQSLLEWQFSETRKFGERVHTFEFSPENQVSYRNRVSVRITYRRKSCSAAAEIAICVKSEQCSARQRRKEMGWLVFRSHGGPHVDKSDRLPKTGVE
jgi:hypothetical protein